MASIINKRQQARNERALHELIRTVPGNDRCADCQAGNPGWASWNLGVFLCMRCGSLHRKMGTHISKVKSLSMDSWTSEQVENMKKRGNAIVNKEYNPRNIKPDIPVDVDEADSAMERFIRQKYEHRILEDGKPKPPSRDDSGYHTQKSLDESPPPPPIPPKSGRKFGFNLRSVSSTSRLPRSPDKSSISSPRSATLGGPLSPSLSLNKQSRVFGTNVGEADGSFEAKLDQLRSMGFPNDKRNSSVLKGVGGDMTRAVESLIRLGEGSGPPPAAPPKPSTAMSQPSPSPPKTEADDPWSISPNVNSSAGARATAAPAKSYNPFDVPTTQASGTTGLEGAFQNLQVAQPMSPHTTGGYVSYQMSNNMALTPLQTSQSYTSSPQPLSYNPFFQTASLTSQNVANPYYTSHTAQSTPIQPSRSFSPGNPFANSLSAQSTGTQQHLSAVSQSQRFAMPRHANTMPVFSSSSVSIPSQSTASYVFFSQSQQPSPHQVSNTNPFDINSNTHNPYQNYPTNHQQPQYQQFQHQNPYAQFQQNVPQQPTRADKNSILALYNLAPAAAPPMSTIPEQSQVPQTQQTVAQQQNIMQASNSTSTSHTAQGMFPTMLQSSATGSGHSVQNSNPFMHSTPQQQQQPQLQPQQPQQQQANPFAIMSQSTPAAPASSKGLGIGLGSNTHNPYQQMAPQQPQQPQLNNFMPRAPIHMSKASVDINNLQSGRHSPDAFASLSARFA
ncbi:GTPase activating protein for Arf, putative [Talaromyces stipitatus ATCC 10500]|uniref:GTPase activating protein for Arf, putative n=1 Tax=Talaromyces stipitatus (strain ATCC 10500 / CBS 375.48 / QM 6759 / NRRL 1006) TaxID=441959 RepID=B8ME81_TALSN|nr:GTPase activating protein for Arf, putative [Talaromyces stipitatus ATCC 10500]EED16508.1 GTPase activating protein for Arf, putative [Talaromyces stipitatus ATCC 10500]